MVSYKEVVKLCVFSLTVQGPRKKQKLSRNAYVYFVEDKNACILIVEILRVLTLMNHTLIKAIKIASNMKIFGR